MKMHYSWGDLPDNARAAVLVVLAIQVALAIVALVRLAKTPDNQLRLMPRATWIIVILLGQMAGPIIFMLMGRATAPIDTTSDSRPIDTKRTIDDLYGSRHE